MDDRQNIVVQKLTELNAQLTRAKIERLDKEAMYNRLLDIRKNGESLESIPVVMANDYVQKLKVEIAGLEERRSQMAAQVRAELAADEGAGDDDREHAAAAGGGSRRRGQLGAERLPDGQGQRKTRSPKR